MKRSYMGTPLRVPYGLLGLLDNPALGRPRERFEELHYKFIGLNKDHKGVLGSLPFKKSFVTLSASVRRGLASGKSVAETHVHSSSRGG